MDTIDNGNNEMDGTVEVDGTDIDIDREDLKFTDFRLSPKVIQALNEMNYTAPTAVQKETILPALEGKDLIVLSKTGSGKTAAFGIPAIQLLSDKKVHKVLILAPTRELAVQVESEISTIAKHMRVKSLVVYGKHSIDVEIEKIKKGLDILVGTPGRVLDHIEQENFDARAFDLVILDEADRMLDMGFIDQVDKIISKTSVKRTTFLFSATIPEEIVRLSAKYLDNPHTIQLSSDVKTVEEVEQYYLSVKRNEKRERLLDVLSFYHPESCIVFCNTRYEVDRVTDFLVNRGITSKSIHGANSQTLRLKFLNQFKKGDFKVLVATDVAARGLHIEGLELVVNYNIPVEKDSYVHRIGRTGRAGKKGLAISFVQEGELYQLYSLEEHVGVRIEEVQISKRARTNKGAENTRDLYGVSFRELSKYDPDAADGASKGETEKKADHQAPKKKKKRRVKKNRDHKENADRAVRDHRGKENKDHKENKEHKEHKESRSVKENRNYKGNRDKDSRAPKMKAEKKQEPNRRSQRKYVCNIDEKSDEPVQILKVENTQKRGIFSRILGVFKKGGEKK